MGNDSVSRSWFCVFNNPQDHGYGDMEPPEVLEAMAGKWVEAFDDGACYLAYCISSDGLKHVHAVLETGKPSRFSAVRNVYPGMHIEPTKGSKKQVEDYVNKCGAFEEKGEAVICTKQVGEIRGSQRGRRSDISEIVALLDDGMKPDEVFAADMKYRK